jgi:hypothetical protein
MPKATQKKDLGAWLEKPSSRKLLARIARGIYRELTLRHIPFGFLDQERPLNEAPENVLAAIQSELTLFILEKPSVMKDMPAAGEGLTARYLRQVFIGRCLDIERRRGTDRFRPFYKRAAAVLRHAEGIHRMVARGRSTAYSLDPASRGTAFLTREDLDDIPFPAERAGGLSYESINKKAVITDLATYFWREISCRWDQQPVWVELKDFVHWIHRHVPLNLSLESQGADGIDRLQQLSDGDALPQESGFDPEKVKKWAHQFAARLSGKQKAVLFLRCFQHHSLREIAAQLNYQGSSGPKYVLEAGMHELRKFLRPLPWLSPEDLNQEAFALFMDTLGSILKNFDSKS